MLSAFYTIDRKIYKITRTKLYISGVIFVISLLELLKYEIPNVIFEKIQSFVLLFIPIIIFSFFNQFLNWNFSKKVFDILYFVATVTLILALTNKFHNLFWKGYEISTVVNGYHKYYRLIPGPISVAYAIFSGLILLITIIKIIKTQSLIKVTRFEIAITILFSTLVSFLSLYVSKSYSEMVFALSLTTFIIELLLVKMNWKKASFGAAMLSFKNSSDPIIVLDNDQNIIDLNSAGAELLKFNSSSVDKIKGKQNSLIEEIISKEGQIIKLEQRYFYVTFQKSQDYAMLILKDITNEFTTRQLAEQFSALFNSLFENVPDGVIILTKDGVIINCNTQFVKMFGYSKEEVLGKNIDTLIIPSNLSDEPKRLRELVTKQKMLRVETTRKRKDGKEIEVRITVAKIEQFIPGFLNNETDLLYAFYTDITAEKEAINVARNAVQRDTLTGLYTRSYFLRKLASLTEFSSIEDHHALIFIDIANFSEFNLLKGHKMGDEFLKKVSQRLKMVLREGDTIARPYADEFWILIEKAGKSYEMAKTNAKTILSKLINELSKPYAFNNIYNDGSETYEANFYVGIHLFSVSDTPEEALRKANVALTKSKNSQDRIVFYSTSIDNELQEKSVKEKALKMALYNGELKIFLQPICNYSGNILGAEALLRWVKKDGTVLPPYEFIDLLEENGMIIPVGEDVLRQVCEFLTGINKNGSNNINKITFVDLNVSPIQLRDPELGKRFSEIIKAYDISPSKIVLEFTENILIDMNKDVKKNMEYLLDSGFELCIDDFGAGYSSLSYLTTLPIRKIKIDRSFVFNIPSDRRSIKLLEAIYNIARSFNLEAIPEGVENEKQLEILSMIGFKLFQGFFFGKPVSVDEFIKRFT